MKLWLVRHGQTDLNKKNLMQGLVDQPLNDFGRDQARRVGKLKGDLVFDVVYASPLSRAKETAAIIAGIPLDEVKIDPRIIEVDFGPYDKKPFKKLGLKMWAYWLLPEVFPNPKSVESIDSMTKRAGSFLKDLEKMPYDNVLVVCHGGIIRALTGYLENKKNKIKWRPKPKNCELKVYNFANGKWTFEKSIIDDK